ncbi:MAG: hypothetical protein MZU97_15330 [Bacillus subtilis]|nr:hypothetical protein [Bacillus subtilis]
MVQLYKSFQTLNNGDVLQIKATDPGFLKDIRILGRRKPAIR